MNCYRLLLVILPILCFLSFPARARIGETLAECTNRYGNGIMLTNATALGYSEYAFRKDKIDIRIKFTLGGKAASITYTKTLIPVVSDNKLAGYDDSFFTEKEIYHFMAINTGFYPTDGRWWKQSSDDSNENLEYWHFEKGENRLSVRCYKETGKYGVVFHILKISFDPFIYQLYKAELERDASEAARKLNGF